MRDLLLCSPDFVVKDSVFKTTKALVFNQRSVHKTTDRQYNTPFEFLKTQLSNDKLILAFDLYKKRQKRLNECKKLAVRFFKQHCICAKSTIKCSISIIHE